MNRKLLNDSLSSDSSFHFDSNFRFIMTILTLFFVILFVRIWYLQILQGKDFRRFSEKNLFKKSVVHAPRGVIYDRDGRVLAENLPDYKATVTPQHVTDLEALADALGEALKMDPARILKKVQKSRRQSGPFQAADIKLNLSKDELFKVELLKMDHPGLQAQEVILRHYPHGSMAAHVLGYVREISKKQIPVLSKKRNIPFKPKDIVGKNGLEEHFDSEIRGQNGSEFIVVDAKGKKSAQDQEKMSRSFSKLFQNDPATLGRDLITTIDLDLQKAAYEAFEKNNRVGSLVAMGPTGEILAWVSYPAYDPNEYSKRFTQKQWDAWINNPDRPLGNKVIQDHYPPGSTFKPIVALAALQEDVITEDRYVFAPAKLKLGRRTYHDWNREGNGYINVIQALERSSNTFFFKQGQELGVDAIAKYSRALGLGQKTNVPLKGEASGLIPTRAWKLKEKKVPWQTGESLLTAIGQSFVLTTGLQLAMAYNSIANDGKVYKPQLVRKLAASPHKAEVSFAPDLLRDLSDPQEAAHIAQRHFRTVKKGLFNVVNGKKGTAQRAKLKGTYKISGKTGTVQVRSFSAAQIYKDCTKRPRKFRHHGMFVGYAPSDTPEITVAVLTEHSCFSRNAIPIARDVILKYLKKYKGYDETGGKDGEPPQS